MDIKRHSRECTNLDRLCHNKQQKEEEREKCEQLTIKAIECDQSSLPIRFIITIKRGEIKAHLGTHREREIHFYIDDLFNHQLTAKRMRRQSDNYSDDKRRNGQ